MQKVQAVSTRVFVRTFLRNSHFNVTFDEESWMFLPIRSRQYIVQNFEAFMFSSKSTCNQKHFNGQCVTFELNEPVYKKLGTYCSFVTVWSADFCKREQDENV